MSVDKAFVLQVIYIVLCLSRRNNKFRVFGGLWFGEEKPFFSTFFKPFVDTLQETEINGKLHFCSSKPFFYITCGSYSPGQH